MKEKNRMNRLHLGLRTFWFLILKNGPYRRLVSLYDKRNKQKIDRHSKIGYRESWV